MKKLHLFWLLVIILVLSGCAKETPAPIEHIPVVSTESMVEESAIVQPTPDPFYDLATSQESKWGFKGIYAYELFEKMNEEEFFFYLHDSTMPNSALEEMIQWGFEEENLDVLANGYVIDFSTLNDTEKEKIREVFTQDTLYAIQNGVVKSILSDFPLLPAEDSSDYDMEYKLAVESWFYSTMVGVNNHGLETITYEEVLTKMSNEETFYLYVGRNSCKYCQTFVPVLESFLEQYDITVIEEPNNKIPVYYLDTQPYHNDIIYDVPEAKEIWQEIKETFHLEYVPGFLVFDKELVCEAPYYIDKETTPNVYGCKHFIRYIDSAYFTASNEDRKILFEECRNSLYKSIYLFSDMLEKSDCYVKTIFNDDRDFLYNRDISSLYDCFTYNEKWSKRIDKQEFIDANYELNLEDSQNKILNYSVHLSQFINEYQYGLHFGTGFIIDIDDDCLYIATNKHVISHNIGTNLGYKVQFAYTRKQPKSSDFNKYYMESDITRPFYLDGIASIVGYSKNYDFAILRFDFEENNVMFEEKFGFVTPPRFDNVSPQIGDKVYRWDVRQLKNSGSGKMTIKEYTINNFNISNDLGTNFIQLNGNSSQGTSGSPFFNEKGELVGILVGGNNEYTYIIPSSIILQEFEKIMGRPLYDE